MNDVLIGLIAVLANISVCGIMFGLQYLEDLLKRKQIDPQDPENRFLYFQDYSIFWGDLVGLSLVDIALSLILYERGITGWYFALPIILGVGLTVYFYKEWIGESHLPDWAYQLGGSSWAGKLHTLYFGVQIAIVVLLLELIWPFERLSLISAVIGIVYYVFTQQRDVRSGRMT